MLVEENYHQRAQLLTKEYKKAMDMVHKASLSSATNGIIVLLQKHCALS